MRQFGKVEIPREAFIAALKMDKGLSTTATAVVRCPIKAKRRAMSGAASDLRFTTRTDQCIVPAGIAWQKTQKSNGQIIPSIPGGAV